MPASMSNLNLENNSPTKNFSILVFTLRTSNFIEIVIFMHGVKRHKNQRHSYHAHFHKKSEQINLRREIYLLNMPSLLCAFIKYFQIR